MNNDVISSKEPYQMEFDVGTIKHLGLQMYSTLPPIIGELVANAWDANATKVEIKIPEGQINEQTSEIVISDNGLGMSDQDVRAKYLVIGRDRREQEKSEETPAPYKRKIMGRKGIGKFSAFGIAKEIVIESVKDSEVSHFRMNYDELLEQEKEREIEFPPLAPTGTVSKGTKITLRYITKFKTRSIQIKTIRRRLARRFSVIGPQQDFEIIINNEPISVAERDLKRSLEKDMDGKPYLWEYNNEEIQLDTGWKVSGWIGALNRSSPGIDDIDRGIVLMARGKLVQEPFIFEAVVGQQYALSYLVGELHVEFVDEAEDTIGTTRNSLVWDTDPNIALKEWGEKQMNKIAREWGKKRSADNKRRVQENPLYSKFRNQAEEIGNQRALKLADQLVRQAIEKNPIIRDKELERLTQMCLDFLEFDAFWEIAADLTETDFEDTEKLVNLIREWQIVEAKEMARVSEGRIKAIEKFQKLIENNALEVPTLHNFLKEFPWMIDPRWTLVVDELRYSKVLDDEFRKNTPVLEKDRKMDFICVREGTNLIVVEIKRPNLKVSVNELNQIEEYVSFMRDHIQQTTDPEYQYEDVIGYLLCGDLVKNYRVTGKRRNLANSRIYVRQYTDLLDMVKRLHAEFLKRYNKLRKAKQRNQNLSDS